MKHLIPLTLLAVSMALPTGLSAGNTPNEMSLFSQPVSLAEDPPWLTNLDAFADWFQAKTWNHVFPHHKDWHSWIHHATVAATFTGAAWVLDEKVFKTDVGAEKYAAGFMVVFYLWREMLNWHSTHSRLDSVMDVVTPAMVFTITVWK